MKKSRSKVPFRKKRGGSAVRPKKGIAGSGRAMDPSEEVEKAARDPEPGDAPRAAPPPRVPIADDVYEQLKRKARTTRLRRSKYGQEDPSG
jgi:hypothetical protein